MNSFQVILWLFYLLGVAGLLAVTGYLLRRTWSVRTLAALLFFMLTVLVAPGPVGYPHLGWAPAWIVLLLEQFAEQGNYWRGLLPLLLGCGAGLVIAALFIFVGRSKVGKAKAEPELGDDKAQNTQAEDEQPATVQ